MRMCYFTQQKLQKRCMCKEKFLLEDCFLQTVSLQQQAKRGRTFAVAHTLAERRREKCRMQKDTMQQPHTEVPTVTHCFKSHDDIWVYMNSAFVLTLNSLAFVQLHYFCSNKETSLKGFFIEPFKK